VGRLAAHWGFDTRARPSNRAQTNWKVERPVEYRRTSLFNGREHLVMRPSPISAPVGTWRSPNVRIYGTTGQSPRHASSATRNAALQSLSGRTYRSMVLAAPRVWLGPTRRVTHVADERLALAHYGGLLAEGAL
jgi:hypothetical protein